MPGLLTAGDEHRTHDRQLADDGDEAPARLELCEQGARQFSDRAREHDHVERAVDRQGDRSIGLDDFGIENPCPLQVRCGEPRQLGMHLQRRHVLGLVGEQGGHVARAGTDLEDALVALHAEFLEQPGLDLGLQHRLAARQGHLGVDERHRAIGGRQEVLALDDRQQRQDVLVEHLPGADLLLDHVEAGLLDVHGGRSAGKGSGRPPFSPLPAWPPQRRRGDR